MQYKATTIQEYIEQLPEDRKGAIQKLLGIIRSHIPPGFEETLSYGMIGFVVPHRLYAPGYHCDPKLPLPFVNLASQKNYIALYHSGIYADKNLYEWFVVEYPKHATTKLDMGKSCIRFKKMSDIPYDLIGDLMTKMTPQQWIALYEKNVKR
ncbi:DUF1801 domain-containing protein [Zhouia amylolytica]|uniref:DUF1801 domain-containing protein n=1 Tax=Zhouia amylolytica TaxID=376730 RepID=UPI0020CD4921|nr:DUF1801 domain-containing protein [Zhouia amylolytica]MCQ0111416.1 DUF1801 domain-containing protein [Zhouia amylolytica]